MSNADRIIGQLKKGPATCWQISRATGIPVLRISSRMNQLRHELVVKKAGETRNEHGNLVQIWALTEHKTTLLDECWTRPATLEYREGA